MKTIRHYHTLQTMLLLAVLLLTAQTWVQWHDHDYANAQESSCQLCVHAQQQTPVPATLVVHALALFTQITVSIPPTTKTTHSLHHFYIPSRAPPAPFLA